MNKGRIAQYIPAVGVLAVAGFDSSSLGIMARATLVNAIFLFAWGACFTLFLLFRFADRHKHERDEMALAKLMNGSGIYMFNISLLGGFVFHGIWDLLAPSK